LAKKRRQEELLAQLDFDKNIIKRFDEIKMSRLKLQEELENSYSKNRQRRLNTG